MIHYAMTEIDAEEFHWVSLDGETWLPVNRPPAPNDTEASIHRLFEGDGNFKPMVFARRYLVANDATFFAGCTG